MKKREVVRVGVDLAKDVIQVHAVDAAEAVVVARQLRRSEFLPWCAQLRTGCVVAMEACCAAHYWARQLEGMGLVPKLIAPSFIPPYRMEGRTGKNDANDAAAICEAASRPHMRFVSIKTAQQQGILTVHRQREGYIRDRTACINRLRGLLSEFGIVLRPSPSRFRKIVPELLQDPTSELPSLVRQCLRRMYRHFVALEKQIDWCDAQVKKHAATDPSVKLAMTVPGIGILGASALVATVTDVRQFKSGRQLSAWVGLVPSQRSSGQRNRTGRITKKGDAYLRKLLVIGARAALRNAPGKEDGVSKWAVQLRERIGLPKATVALANRNARTFWRLLFTDNPRPAVQPGH